MIIDYNGKVFSPVSSTDNGEVNGKTIFRYYQEEDMVRADYSGGCIKRGQLIAKVNNCGELDMRYQHINLKGELMTGKCISQPELMSDGRVRLKEKWEWTSGDFSKGESIIEEIQSTE